MRRLRGVGAQLAGKLEALGIHAPRDLLFHLPYRYQDRTRIHAIGEAQPGEALILGRIVAAEVQFGRRRSLLVRVRDDSGEITLRFFHFSAAQQRGFIAGAWIRCYGEIRRRSSSASTNAIEMIHPEYRLYPHRPSEVTEPSLTPVYPSTEGVGAATLRKLVAQAFDEEIDGIVECIPESVRARFALMPLADALRTAHRPPPDADTAALLAGQHPALARLAIEELLAHHLALSRLRTKHRAHRSPSFAAPSGDARGKWEALRAQLGFDLTCAQQRVIDEILDDLSQHTPTLRLIQGDVGCGKTVVAAAAALRAIDANWQVALMVPTELLSEQHRKTFAAWFARDGVGVAVEWLTGKMPARERAAAMARIESGEAQMIIGTHALFQQQVEFHRLGLLIVDEQHRFGVGQRLALRNKAAHSDGDDDAVPHQLIMSATPIPRSLAMIFYADLDVSNIDELPPGRKAVQTVALPNSRRAEVAARVRAIQRRGQQAYWVCPLIEESDKLQAQAATETHAALGEMLGEMRIDLIHGRMKAADKEAVMRRFHRGEIDLLVATTVIEVGVDVPAATLMVIENAERLGLAQLHQLRGRVGRGGEQATCVLLYQPPLGNLARERIGILRRTNDGFAIANKDLEQRGPGEVLGTRQTGLQQMKIADLARDRALLPKIERLAEALRADAGGEEAVAGLIDRWVNVRAAFAEV